MSLTLSPISAGDGYTAYTPTWTSNASAPVIGNATVTARYVRIGRLVHAWGCIAFGSSSTFGSGQYYFDLPVAAAAFGTSRAIVGTVSLFDSSGSVTGLAAAQLESATKFKSIYGATYLGAETIATSSTPWTWAQSDVIAWNLLYEAA